MGNPMNKLQHSTSYPQNQYQPHQQQPMGGFFGHHNMGQSNQNPQGLFGNFIMNQLSNNMHGSNKNINQGSNHNIQNNPYHKQW